MLGNLVTISYYLTYTAFQKKKKKGTLGPISWGRDEAREQEADVGVLGDRVKHLNSFPTDDCQILERVSQNKK